MPINIDDSAKVTPFSFPKEDVDVIGKFLRLMNMGVGLMEIRFKQQ